MGHTLLHEAIGLLLISIGCLAAPPGSQTAYIVPQQQADFNPVNHTYNHLAFAVTDPNYDVILLAGDYRVQPSLWPESQPVRRTRNLTISTFNYAEEGYALLELEFLEARVIIAANTTVTLKDIALGRARKSSGQQVPFFAGEGETSVLVLQNVARLRTACANNSYDLAAALQEGYRTGPSSVGLNRKNVATVVTFRWRGQDYPDSLHAVDVATFVNPGDVTETRSFDAGYTLFQVNATRVCLAYVSDACVAQSGVDACVVARVDQILDGETGAGRPAIAAIVAPVVIAGVLIPAAVAAFLLYRRRKRRRHYEQQQQQQLFDSEKGLPLQQQEQQQQQQALLPRKDGSSGGAGGGGGGAVVLKARDIDPEDDLKHSDPGGLPGAHGGASGSIEALAVGNTGGWQLLACHTSPEFKDATPNDKIKLGVLLGAGSFGRVYKGRWHNMDVAVKVLQHDSTTAAAISNEVDLVMSFRHPNIVAAYHFVTWTQQASIEEQLTTPSGIPRSHLRPVTETTLDTTLTHNNSNFPRPPAVVIAGRDGSTMSSNLPTARTHSSTTEMALHHSGSTAPVSAAAAVPAAAMAAVSRSPNSTSSSNVPALLAVLTSGREKNNNSGSTISGGGTVGSLALPAVLGGASAGGTSTGTPVTVINTDSNMAGSQSFTGQGFAGQGFAVQGFGTEGHQYSESLEGMGRQGSAGLGSINPSQQQQGSEAGQGLANLPHVKVQGLGSGHQTSAALGHRQNSGGSTVSTSSNTAAIAAILAAGRQQQQGNRSPAVRRFSAAAAAGGGDGAAAAAVVSGGAPPRSPMAAAAAAAAADVIVPPNGHVSPFAEQAAQQGDAAGAAAQRPMSPFAAAAVQGEPTAGTATDMQLQPSLQHYTQQQQQQQQQPRLLQLSSSKSDGAAVVAAVAAAARSRSGSLSRATSSQDSRIRSSSVTRAVSNNKTRFSNASSGGASKQSSGSVVDVRTPSQPVQIPSKVASSAPYGSAAAAAAVAAAANSAGLAAVGGPNVAAGPAPAAAAAGVTPGSSHGKLQLPAAALRSSRQAASAHPTTSGETMTAASSGGGVQGPPTGSLDPPPAATAAAAGSSNNLGQGVGGASQQQQQQPPVSHKGAAQAGVNDGSFLATSSPFDVPASSVAALQFVPFTPALLYEYEHRQTAAGSSTAGSSHLTAPSAAAGAAAGNTNSQGAAVNRSQAAAAGQVLEHHVLDLQQQQGQRHISPAEQMTSSGRPQQWHALGQFLSTEGNVKLGGLPSISMSNDTAAAAAAAAAMGRPLIARPTSFSGSGFAGPIGVGFNSSLGRPGGRIGGARQPAEAQTWLILEYCNGGTLLDLLQDGQLTTQGPRKKQAFILTLLSDVAAGMLYLHRRNVLHGDLKPGNILIRYESGLPYGRAAKVSDFGLSRALQVGQSHRSTRTMGTMNHTPPELLRLGRLSPAGDVYAFGIIMWEVYTGHVAFHGLHYGEVFEQVALWQKRPPIPDDMPEEYAVLMTECWAADPFRRPTFDIVQNRLREMLDQVVQDEKEAQDRFVADL